MYSGKDLAELSGYTSRVYALLSSLHALNNEIYPVNPRPKGLRDDEVGLTFLPALSFILRVSGMLNDLVDSASADLE